MTRFLHSVKLPLCQFPVPLPDGRSYIDYVRLVAVEKLLIFLCNNIYHNERTLTLFYTLNPIDVLTKEFGAKRTPDKFLDGAAL